MSQDHASSFKDLFKRTYIGIFLKTCSLWFLVAFMFYGQLSLLPYWLQKSKKGFSGIFLSVLGELPVCALAFVLVDKQACGRKRLLMFFSGMEAILALATYFAFDIESLLVGLMFATRFFMKGIFCVLYVYTSEIFPTNVRIVGYGWANCVGRISAIAMPFIVFWLYDIEIRLPMIGFCLCGLLSLAVSWKLPFDTSARELDVLPDASFKNSQSVIELSDYSSFCTEKYLSMNSNSFEIKYSGNIK